tara:strand:+ start:36 stop:377 length:342 start_codon:yes stop_codon:yes gene_type:complete
MNLVEKAELVFKSFERCMDLDIAFAKNGISDDDRVLIEADANFDARLQLRKFEVQEELFVSLRSLVNSPNESIQLQATVRLGEMLYPKRFGKSAEDDVASRVPQVISLMGASD